VRLEFSPATHRPQDSKQFKHIQLILILKFPTTLVLQPVTSHLWDSVSWYVRGLLGL
jgi:hypothetical protein